MQYLERLSKLKEIILIKKVYFWALVPALIFGLTSLGVPLMYVLIPAHESGMCICNKAINGLITFKPLSLQIVISFMFYGLNWIFLLMLVWMLFKIRHINDKLKIKSEMGYIIATWLLCSIL